MKNSEEWAQYSSSVMYFIVLVCLVSFYQSTLLVMDLLINSLIEASTEGSIDIGHITPPGYDYLHPPKEENKPVIVNVTITKINIRQIDESDMSFSVTIEMWQSWTDFRLKYPSWAEAESSILDSSWINKIWNPKLYFRNAIDGKLDNIITPSSFFWLKNDKKVFYCCRVILTLICEMDLKFFPHDKQECGIEMSSSVYNGLDMALRWSSTARLPYMISLQQYEVRSVNYSNNTVPFGRSNFLYCLRMSVVLSRRTGYYIINVYIPTILIVIMSMLTFWIPPDAVPARVTLGVTSLLTIITKQYQASMPNVSYIVALNVWLSSCIGFVFFSLLEFAAVIALSNNAKKTDKVVHNHHHTDFSLPMVTLRSNGTWTTNRPIDEKWAKKSRQGFALKENLTPKENLKPRRLDLFSRIFFPLAFVVFAVIYWQIYDS